MAASFQEQSRKRKLIYIGLILGLFTAALLHRQQLLDPKAKILALRQEQQGSVELNASALRLMLTGSRGLAVCFLWYRAIDQQRRHEWNKLSTLVRTVTKLQPHFITPWLFQSWNLAYNVSVENDRIRDKYFYITQGIELLADGERKNRNNVLADDGVTLRELNHPELCFNLGFYYQQKIGTHDNQNTLLSLLQMSAIDPRYRDPKRLRPLDSANRPVVDLAEFARFCQRHPILVRRLREVLRYQTPEEVVEFLASNQKLPSRFEEGGAGPTDGEIQPSRLKDPREQFPVIAPLAQGELLPGDHPDEVDFSTFTAARTWFTYAQKPLPETDRTFVEEIKQTFDPKKFRMPKSMAHLIFRGYPARAMDYVASHLQREGWFAEDGWRIVGWFPKDEFSTERGPVPAVVGAGRKWTQEAWTRAWNMYQDYGGRTGLYIDNEEMLTLEKRAEAYRTKFGITGENSPPADLKKEDPLFPSYAAHVQLFWYGRNRSMTNFPHFYHKTSVEHKEDTIRSRKAFFEAERYRRTAQSLRALERYVETLPMWRRVLRENKEFRRDQFIQEETYESQLRYLNLAREDRRPLAELKPLGGRDAENWRAPAVRQVLHLQDMLSKAGSVAGLFPIHIHDIGPFDWLDDPTAPDAQPFISDSARNAVNSRR